MGQVGCNWRYRIGVNPNMGIIDLILQFFTSLKPSTPEPKEEAPVTPEPIPADEVTLDDWITSSGKYMARASSPELTDEVKANAELLLGRINRLLKDIEEVRSVNSGFRTSASNKKAGGAKKSRHMTGEAIDLDDDDGSLDALIDANPELLEKFDLYRESPTATPGWCHLQTAKASKRTFLP